MSVRGKLLSAPLFAERESLVVLEQVRRITTDAGDKAGGGGGGVKKKGRISMRQKERDASEPEIMTIYPRAVQRDDEEVR